MAAGLRKPETVRDLLGLVMHLRDVIAAHRALWEEGRRSSYKQPRPDFDEQQREMARVLVIIDPYLTRYSAGRSLHHPATGLTWDVYRGAMSGPSPLMKQHSLEQALLDLEGVIALLNTSDLDSPVDSLTPGALRERRVFVSHGKESSALTKVERFLRGLGLTPVIVRFEASQGGSVDDVVEREMASCECAVILATT